MLALGRRRYDLLAELRLAEQLNLVREDGFARRKVREPPRHADLVALINPGVALDRLHQRARFALLGGAAFAKAAAAQPGPQFVNRHGRCREIVGRKEVGVHRQVGFDPLETRDDARQRAYMLAKTRDRRPWRNGAIAAARHDELVAGAEFDRDRLPSSGSAAACGRSADIAGAPPRDASRWLRPRGQG